MFRHDIHLEDDELLLAIDRELPSRRQAAIDEHLARCPVCRTRSARLQQAARSFVDECARDLEIPASAAESSRARLQSSLREASAQWDQSWRARASSVFAQRPQWLLAGTGVVAVALFMVTLLPWGRFDRALADGSIEPDALPVASLTPGATSNLSAEELCRFRARDRRPISAEMRQRVLRNYGMEHVPSADYELDYLITPELGGATDARNLWPQRYGSRAWNARVKDQLEHLLPSMVCSGQLELKTAQRAIAADWIAAYRKYFKARDPLESRSRPFDDDDQDEVMLISLRARP